MSPFRKLTRIASLVCLLILSACASASEVHEMSQGKKIGVVSYVGDDLKVSWIGTTIFNNEEGTYKGFNVNQLITDFAVSELQKTNRYPSVVAAAPEKGKSCNNVPSGFDYVVCFQKFSSDNVGPWFEGVGIVRRTMFGLEGYTNNFVRIGASAYNEKADHIRWKVGSDIWDPGFHLEKGPKIPESARPNLETDFRTHIQQTVSKILMDLGLMGSVEPNEWSGAVGF